jgi:hypothetical protein
MQTLSTFQLVVEDDQYEVNIGQHIGRITSGGQTTSNVYGAHGTTTTVVNRKILRYIIQHSKISDFIFLISNKLKKESNYQIWSFIMTQIDVMLSSLIDSK